MKINKKILVFGILFMFLFGFSGKVLADEQVDVYLGQTLYKFQGLGWNILAQHFSKSSANWNEIEKNFDKMNMRFARIPVYIEWWRPEKDRYNFESLEMRGIYKFLEYADKHNIDVLIANWNVGGKYDNQDYWWLSEVCHLDPQNTSGRWFVPYWNGESGPWHDHPYSEDEFAESIARLIDYLKNKKGFKSVKYVSIWNEPNGFYISHCDNVLCSKKSYPEDFRPLYKKVKEHLNKYIANFEVELVGGEISIPHLGDGIENIGNMLSSKAVTGEKIDKYIDTVSIHHYSDVNLIGNNGIVYKTKKQIYNNDFDNKKERIILGEIGTSGVNVKQPHNTLARRFGNSFLSVKKIIAEAKQGAFAIARWIYNGMLYFAATSENGSKIIPEVFNPIALLSASMPQGVNTYIPKVELSLQSKTWPSYLDSVAITFWHKGANRNSIWLISKDTTLEKRRIKFNFHNLKRDIVFQKYFIEKEDPIIKKGNEFKVTTERPYFIDQDIPGKSIVVYTEYKEILDELVCGNQICEFGETPENCFEDCKVESIPKLEPESESTLEPKSESKLTSEPESASEPVSTPEPKSQSSPKTAPTISFPLLRSGIKVYRIINNKRHWIPNPEVFNAYGYDWNRIQQVGLTELTAYPQARLLRAEGDIKVYYLTESDMIRHIPSPEVFNSYNYKWEDIISISSTELSSYPVNDLIRLENGVKVYKLENGKKRWIKTAETFNRLGYDWTKIAPVNQTELNYYPEGETIE